MIMKYVKGWESYNESNESNPQKFDYMMLSRLQRDCEYYLGHGGRHEKHLWANTVEEHIAEMKKLWNGLIEKPEWLSMEDILDYEKQMTDTDTDNIVSDKYYVVWEEDGQEDSELIDNLEDAKEFYNQIKMDKFNYEKPKMYMMSYTNGDIIQGEKWNE